MRRSTACCRRLVRRCCHGNGPVAQQQQQASAVNPLLGAATETGPLARQLLERHRQRHTAQLSMTVSQQQQKQRQLQKPQEQSAGAVGVRPNNSKPAPDAVESYGKAALVANLAHVVDVSAVGTRDLMQATEKEWDALTAQSRLSAALAGANSKRAARMVMRHARSASAARLAKSPGDVPTPYEVLLQRYATVVPTRRANPATSEATCSWRVNMPAVLKQKGTLRGVLARREQLERHREWQLVKDVQFPAFSAASGHGPMACGNNVRAPSHVTHSTLAGSSSSSNSSGIGGPSSPVFRRYCLEFGSCTLRQAGFLTDPMTYYVLSNLHLTGDESLLEVRQKAEALSHRYKCAHLP
ncbi:hypothetical protein DQ04_00781010 [Trypanosoma grayi]|uniref:hypothetical protein n=1 Tax=Trypanosoma grayi TaxID=71804 RepID=UPI0004F4AD36|nr:hypothetical protein DQ04_00781010 [Trypanosoma grayi]KEG13790.1 hypothetical protein DQ04_00781010 [Trypanosoma grayi]